MFQIMHHSLISKNDLDVSFSLKDSYLYGLCQTEVGTVGFVKEGAGEWNLFLITVKVYYVLVVSVPSKKCPATDYLSFVSGSQALLSH